MKIPRVSPPMRLFLAVVGTMLWLGIGFTGFGVVHWLLWVPTLFFTFAVITGICPGMIISNFLFARR